MAAQSNGQRSAEQRMRECKQEMREYEQLMREYGRQMQEYGQRMHGGGVDQMRENGARMREIGARMRECGDRMREIGARMREIGRQMQQEEPDPNNFAAHGIINYFQQTGSGLVHWVIGGVAHNNYAPAPGIKNFETPSLFITFSFLSIFQKLLRLRF